MRSLQIFATSDYTLLVNEVQPQPRQMLVSPVGFRRFWPHSLMDCVSAFLPNPAAGMPILFDPFFAMGTISRFVTALLGPLMPTEPVWYCVPCTSELRLSYGRAHGEVFCPQCRQAMRLHGKQQRQKPDGSIDVTFEPIPVTEIPAKTLQIAAPKEPK